MSLRRILFLGLLSLVWWIVCQVGGIAAYVVVAGMCAWSDPKWAVRWIATRSNKLVISTS